MYSGKRVLFVLLVFAVVGRADMRLASVIGDNMVLQQGRQAIIWGLAEAGEKIKVTGSWQQKDQQTTAGKDGRWEVRFQPPEVGGPYEIVISGENRIVIRNILVGEVWVCSGQSNMEWSVIQSANAEEEISQADYPKIRLFRVERDVATQPKFDCKGSWQPCSAKTVPDFSAVAYYFGRQLYENLDVPIGLIQTAYGGSHSEAWTSRKTLEAEAIYKPVLERYPKALEEYYPTMVNYQQKWQDWYKLSKELGKMGLKAPPEPRWLPPYAAGTYNAMLAPLIGYSIRGVIWYQGEANIDRAHQYRRFFPSMIKNWRDDWGQGDFPFYFVQLANWKAVNTEPMESALAELREAQLMTLAEPNTAMAVAIDLGQAETVHFKNKQDVGKRLALIALAKTYGKELVYSGPIYKSMKIEGSKVILDFDYVDGGLVAKGAEKLKGFAIAAADRKFLWADAKIIGQKVVVSSDRVKQPVAVRYGWADNPVCNLYNKAGLPASPFRTDTWDGVTVNEK